jgi:hypothetical protein
MANAKQERQEIRASLDSAQFLTPPKFARWVTVASNTTNEKGRVVTVRIRTPKRNAALETEVKEWLQSEFPEGVVDVRHTGPVIAIPLRENRPERQQIPDVRREVVTSLCKQEARTPKDAQAAVDALGGTLRIGSPISLVNSRSGAVGFFARDKQTKQIGIVSANHVIAGQDRAQFNEPILSPGGTDYGYRVASFVRAVKLGGGGEKKVDCAFAKLETNDYDPSILPGGMKLQPRWAKVEKDQRVLKFTEASGGERMGIVASADQDAFKMHYRAEIGLVLFDDQIEVESIAGQPRFSEAGDSGALVYDENRQPVGLLFAQTNSGGADNRGFAYVNPIGEVLQLLDVELITN